MFKTFFFHIFHWPNSRTNKIIQLSIRLVVAGDGIRTSRAHIRDERARNGIWQPPTVTKTITIPDGGQTGGKDQRRDDAHLVFFTYTF